MVSMLAVMVLASAALKIFFMSDQISSMGFFSGELAAGTMVWPQLCQEAFLPPQYDARVNYPLPRHRHVASLVAADY